MRHKISYRSGGRRASGLVAALASLALYVAPLAAFGQGTRIDPPKNKYSVQDDVRAGQEAARQVEQQMPILHDRYTEDYLRSVGDRLVAAIPPQYQHPEFHYTFEVVNVRELNAFALPGGPMFVNRGLIEAVENEGELAGVMAHELSHVALRHGTAQATKAQKYQYSAIAGIIAGAVIGGGLGEVVSQGTQLGVGAYFLKFSREYETQADVLGSQIMARAGYNPNDMARMFQLLQRQGGASGPQFLSDHPNPANRYERIRQEAAALGFSPDSTTPQDRTTGELAAVKEHLRGMPRGGSMNDRTRSANARYPTNNGGGRVAYPSSSYRQYSVSNLFSVSVPANWRELTSNDGSNEVTFAPDGAYGNLQTGEFVFTHGVQFGVARAQSGNLRQASDYFINQLLQANSYLRRQTSYRRTNLGGRDAVYTTLSGTSGVTGRGEQVTIITSMLDSNDLFYMIAVSPQDEASNYRQVFANIQNSVRLNY